MDNPTNPTNPGTDDPPTTPAVGSENNQQQPISKDTQPTSETSPSETVPNATPPVSVDSPQETTSGESEAKSPTSIITDSGKKSDKFKYLVIALVVAIIGVWAFVGYTFYNNRTLSKDINEQASQEATAVAIETVTPTPAFDPSEIQIVNGSIHQVSKFGGSNILIDKNDYPATGITGFANVVVSPDNEKLCFESWPPVLEPAMYLSNVDGSQVIEVSPNRRICTWTPDSKKIISTDYPKGEGDVSIYIYSTEKQTEMNLSDELFDDQLIRSFTLEGLSDDSSTILCSYTIVADNEALEGESTTCEIDVPSVVKTQPTDIPEVPTPTDSTPAI